MTEVPVSNVVSLQAARVARQIRRSLSSARPHGFVDDGLPNLGCELCWKPANDPIHHGLGTGPTGRGPAPRGLRSPENAPNSSRRAGNG